MILASDPTRRDIFGLVLPAFGRQRGKTRISSINHLNVNNYTQLNSASPTSEGVTRIFMQIKIKAQKWNQGWYYLTVQPDCWGRPPSWNTWRLSRCSGSPRHFPPGRSFLQLEQESINKPSASDNFHVMVECHKNPKSESESSQQIFIYLTVTEKVFKNLWIVPSK